MKQNNNMKFLVDAKECEKVDLPVDSAFYMAALYFDKPITPNTFINLCKKGLVDFDGFDFRGNPKNPRLNQAGVDLVESIFLNSEFREDNKEDRYDKLAEKLQELFPQGKKPGTQYKWKDSKSIVATKLKALVKKYKVDFTDEQAINATREYIQSFNGNYQYMQILRYFILKRDRITGEEASQFLSYIENAGQEDECGINAFDKVR